MEERKWEDLELDCLVNVLGRVGMESLLLDVPFVCKSWHKASLNPLSWERLDFPGLANDQFSDSFTDRFMHQYGIEKLCYTKFIKSIIDCSCGNATRLLLPNECSEEALKYAVEQCSALRILGLPPHPSFKRSLIIPLIGKWKSLEGLFIRNSINLIEILAQISLNCKNFYGLRAQNCVQIGKEEAKAIISSLPKIKYLHLRSAYIDQKSLVTILKGCKELVYLNVSNCVGFEADDAEILELASHVGTFNCEGSRLLDDDDFDWAIEHDDIYDGYYSD